MLVWSIGTWSSITSSPRAITMSNELLRNSQNKLRSDKSSMMLASIPDGYRSMNYGNFSPRLPPVMKAKNLQASLH